MRSMTVCHHTRSDPHGRDRRRTRLRLPSMPLVLLMFALLSMPAYSRDQKDNMHATVAEQLQQVAEANSRYQGWVHIQVRFQQGMSLPAGAGSVPTQAWEHTNTRDGTWAKVLEFDRRREVTLYLPASKAVARYNSKSGEIRWGDLTADIAKAMAETAATSPPATTASSLASFKKATGRDPAEIRRTDENRMERYDVTFFKDEQEARKFRKDHPQFGPLTGFTLWADRKTKLIQKLRLTQQGVSMIGIVSYGKPEIQGIYDLGVPRDAKVVDNRAGKDVAALLDRLDARAAKGLGKCVAIVTTNPTQNASATCDSKVYLFAEGEDRWLIAEYFVGKCVKASAPESRTLGVLPAGWPRPRLEGYLAQFKDAPPLRYLLRNGKRGWLGWGYNQKSRSYPNARALDPKEWPIMRAIEGLGGTIWPNRWRLNLIGSSSARASLISDAKHAKLTGLRVQHLMPRENGRKERQEHVIWLDPARDDLPVESAWRVFDNDGKTVRLEVRRQYLEYARLANGQWYPLRWKYTRTQFPTRKQASTQPATRVTEYNLVVAPGMELGQEWFVNPAEKFAAEPHPTGPAVRPGSLQAPQGASPQGASPQGASTQPAGKAK